MSPSATAAAAAPPLLPTPPSIRRFAPLLAPSIRSHAASPAYRAPWTRRHAPSPASPAPSTYKDPGRASASESWVRDKQVRAGLAPTSSTGGSKIPGRASLRNSWVQDKLAGTTPSATPSSTENCTGKDQRYDSPTPTPSSDSEESDCDSECEYYAGPAFLNAPPPSALPIPIPSLFVSLEEFEFP
ncbi:vegetative cell wall protein gp1-like [Panicum miliaceum]|uniref:Vegetative cell wall protein gp1-like n=1 Tax=Panicum miliaceum TaxID=4540 RepID=A0A3L6SEG4_PANMI|nr:vegetative cell wall protein gp1-like [Panicum miliaceum]